MFALSLILARLEALLVAVRKAPGAKLEELVAALGDLGTASIRAVDAERGACVEVIVAGATGPVPYGSASDGERLRADCDLRDAWRRKLRILSIPLVVDRTALYAPPAGAAWPRFSGAVRRLVTATPRPGEPGGIVVTPT
jgi:hypothetical protein